MSDCLTRAREILNAEAQAIQNIPLDENFDKAIDVILQCRGKVITTGMGKAGHIAQKTAGTLCSTGTPAVYLHPGEAEHGDLGLLGPGDVILAYSTSGKTREVIEMLKLSHHFGIDEIICITSHPDSQIRQESAIVIDMGIIKEPCHMGLTPSSSTTVMLAISDAIALILSERKNFTKEQFGLRHHGGYLGKKALF